MIESTKLPLSTAAISSYVDANASVLIRILQDLVRIPSENKPPRGAESGVQQYVASILQRSGCEARLYDLAEVEGLAEHPLFWPGRVYEGRPNVAGKRRGAGGGRSLVLSGHVDTVPSGTFAWTRDPFGGAIEGNRLYGRGANDMKAGIATNLFVARALHENGVRLSGDLTIETVVDEEFGGVNGTLAGRLAGYTGDAAVLSEPSFLRVCPAQRGGRIAHVVLSTAGSGGILGSKGPSGGVIGALECLLSALPEFEAHRRASAPAHPMYTGEDRVPVMVSKVSTGPWSMAEPITVAESCRLEICWQAMPGEAVEDIDREFFEWLDSVAARSPHLFPVRPAVEFPIRWLPGSGLAGDNPLVIEFSQTAKEILGAAVPVAGIEGPCDMFVFHSFGVPALLWGPRGGNTHAADEYVELDSLIESAKVLLAFVCRWCGIAN
jgi:acetylornithine deacetylase